MSAKRSALAKAIDTVLKKHLKKLSSKKGPGVGVLVMKQGKAVYKGGYGYANVEEEIPITKDTIFDLASVSKHFTVVGILMLQEQGELSVNDLVSAHLEGWSIPKVCIKHLIWHVSGIADYTGLYFLANGKKFFFNCFRRGMGRRRLRGFHLG